MPIQARPLGFARLQEWRFLQLTVVLGLWMLLSPGGADHWAVQILMQAILLNCMLMTLSVSGNIRHSRVILIALWGLSLAASLALLLQVSPERRELLGRIESACHIPILFACATGILLYVFRRGAITLDGIFAALVAYLLIAFAFAEIYVFLQMGAPESFRLPSVADGDVVPTLAGSMMYFSFVTIATLGYGDILPNTELARMLAVIEAVVGQFYVAVIVALLVSKFIAPAAPAPDAARASPGDIE